MADIIEQESRKIEAVAVMLAQTREDALTPDELASLLSDVSTNGTV
ncbi:MULTISPECIES: hypothetical protein [unclassified Ruegeria]|nr:MULTISPECIES: hypothetical protein [unclassified Ruegeria]